MRRDVLNSPRLKELKKKRRRAILYKSLFLVFVFGIFFSLLVFVSRVAKINISEIQTTGNKVVDEAALKARINEILSGEYLWLFPKTNIFYYPKNTIKKNLEATFSRIKNVELSIKENKILVVTLGERIPTYTWCGDTVQNDAQEKCYFLDEKGYVFDEAPYFSGMVYFKFYGAIPLNTAGAPTGTYFHEADFDRLVTLRNTIETMGLKSTSLYAKEDGDIVINLSPGKNATSNPEIILNINADLNTVAENLQAALNTEPLKSNFKTKYGSLEYLDLRYGNKVYSKFK